MDNDRGGGGLATTWQPATTTVNTPKTFVLGPGTTRRCPVHWAAAVFLEETTATSQIPYQGSRPGAGPPGGPSKLEPGEFSHENIPPIEANPFPHKNIAGTWC